MKEDVHRYYCKSKSRWTVLRERMCIDSIEAWIWEFDEQSKQHHWIHQHHQAFYQERLYNIKTQTDDRNKRQNNQSKSIDWERKIVRNVWLWTESCKSNDDNAIMQTSESFYQRSTSEIVATKTRTRIFLFLNLINEHKHKRKNHKKYKNHFAMNHYNCLMLYDDLSC